ncbi:TAFII55 protein conserved region-domain-containing protein [Suillus paluster]|uniref:TAFII55 protein conserved region-domain-containing protein n=1 Tax=Suillus paluster TaxID=48578 RepID=UPI001B86230E|nr:TAFII55 protein conserved region-domain-containing protein [Suillus paluster]KAG1756648.1 TAFII55 protein conserved region-domain-containing protein [Suillus paluster]
MDDDLIVVDDIEEQQAGPSTVNGAKPTPPTLPQRTRPLRAAAEHAMATTLRLRGTPEPSERTTRSSLAKNRPQPKLKLKLSDKAAAQAPGMSFLGPYDRELDSDDEDLAFEEQFIIRMPPGDDCEKLRKMVSSREVGNDVWFKFKDSRRGVFHIGNTLYSFKLVDLPCIIEAQKTLDNKQMFKVADICQMLVVENRIPNEEAFTTTRNVNVDEFIWPHGITPPLHHVRKRRFRKRVNKRTIESVEEAVERLLATDELATEVKYDVLENVNPDLSDSEFIERDGPLDAPTPGVVGSEAGDAPTPGPDFGGDEGEAEEAEDDEGDGDIDEDLAAELDLALGDEDEEGEGDDEEEDEEDESEEDDEDEDDEEAQERKLLNEEIRDLEAAVLKKQNEIASSANPLIKKRFEDALRKLSADLEMKVAQRDEMKERQRRKREGIAPEDPDTDVEGATQEEVDVAETMGDLFGSDDHTAMDIG